METNPGGIAGLSNLRIPSGTEVCSIAHGHKKALLGILRQITKTPQRSGVFPGISNNGLSNAEISAIKGSHVDSEPFI